VTSFEYYPKVREELIEASNRGVKDKGVVAW